MSLTPTQLQELQTIVLDLGEEFPHNADALWNAAIRIQTGGLGPTSGAGGLPAFEAAVADIKVCQEEVQTYQQRQGSPSSGFDVAVLQVVPATSTFPSGNVGEILYLDIAPNNYVATDQIVITPLGPNSVQLDEVGTTVARTVPAASGGLEINNLSTGGGFERVLTTADSQSHNAEFVTLSLDGSLANERVLTAGLNIGIVDGGAGGNVTINLDAAITGVSVNGVTLSAVGAATNYLDETGAYSVPPGGAAVVGTGVVIPTAGTPYDYDALLEFQNANLLQTATVGWNGTSNFQVRSAAREALVELIGTDTTGVERTLFSGDPDGVTILRYGLLSSVDGGFQLSAPDPDVPFQLNPMAGASPVADFISYNTDRDDWRIHGDIEFTDNPATNRMADFNIDVRINGADRFIQAPLEIGAASNHGSVSLGAIYFVPDVGINRGLFLGRTVFAQNLTDKGASQFGAVFDTDTSMLTDPGTYNLRFNNATPASVTEISIDDTGIGGHDFGDFWGPELVSGDQLFIKQVDDDTRWIIFTLTGPPVDQTGFWTIPVSVNDSGVLPVDTEEINVDVVLASLGGGQVNSVVGGTNISVNVADPINPIVNLDAAITGVSVNGVTLSAAGAATDYLDETGAYSVPSGAISIVGTPVNNQVGIWTGPSALEGDAGLTFNAGLLSTASLSVTNISNSSAINLQGMDENDDGLIFEDGMPASFDDIAQANRVSLKNEGVGGGSGTLSLRFSSTGSFIIFGGMQVNNGSVSVTATALASPTIMNISNSMRVQGSIFFAEQSTADTNIVANSQIWAQNDVPTRLIHTDDADNDIVIAMSGGAVGNNVTVNNSFDFNTTDNRADNWIGQYFDGGNDTITLEDSSSQVNWPLYTTINIIAPGSGVLTVTEGSGVTLFNADGSDTVGGVTISQGVASITRQTASNYIVWGSGIT